MFYYWILKWLMIFHCSLWYLFASRTCLSLPTQHCVSLCQARTHYPSQFSLWEKQGPPCPWQQTPEKTLLAPVQLSAYKPSQLLVHFPRISPFITLWDCAFRAFIQHNTHLEPHSKPSGKIKRSFHLKLLWRCSPVTCHCWLSPAKADSPLWAWRRALKCELHKAGRLRAAGNLFMQDPGPEGSWNSQQAVMNLSLCVN